jgi:hypothetical protein
MLFVVEYTIAWTELDTVLAKRMEWEAVKPPSFRYIGEWVWQEADPPFRGMAVVEAEDVDSLNAYVLHYGPSVKVKIHPATDVPSAMKQATGRGPAPAPKEKRKH